MADSKKEPVFIFMLKGLNDFLDKHEGRKVGSSTKAILKERKRQGYDKAKSKALAKAKGHGVHEFNHTKEGSEYAKEHFKKFGSGNS